jgi:hypothetical protein
MVYGPYVGRSEAGLGLLLEPWAVLRVCVAQRDSFFARKIVMGDTCRARCLIPAFVVNVQRQAYSS